MIEPQRTESNPDGNEQTESNHHTSSSELLEETKDDISKSKKDNLSSDPSGSVLDKL